jgi:large subunit ribosomal protein L35
VPGARRKMEATAIMPKMKTHSGANKRFRVTGSGKLMRRRANMGHLMEHKSTRHSRRLTGDVELAPGDRKNAKKLLGL